MIATMSKPLTSLEQCLLYGAKIGLPDSETNKFYDYFESNGWFVGRVKMKSPEAAMRVWCRRWEESGKPGLVRLAKSIQPRPQMGVWEIDKRLEAIRNERLKLLNHPSRTPKYKPYRMQDGTELQVQDGSSYAPEVQARLDQLKVDAEKLNQMKASAI